jgi:nucleotide-binding universal stress UspA family protein
MRFQHILFPIDFSVQCNQIIPSVQEFVRRFGSRLTLLHVVEFSDEEASDIGSQSLDSWNWSEVEKRQTSKLEEIRRAHFMSGTVEVALRSGDPGSEIAEYSDPMGIDLIMMPSHGYGRFRAALLGSVTAKVIHDTRCPVWTSVHSDTLHDPPYPCRLIVCAVDDLKSSVETIRRAGSLATNFESELMLVHAIMPRETNSESQVRARLEELQRAADVSVPICMGAGPIESVVTQAAKAHGADLLIVGRGHAPQVFGSFRSHVYSIIRDSPCPVLTI